MAIKERPERDALYVVVKDHGGVATDAQYSETGEI